MLVNWSSSSLSYTVWFSFGLVFSPCRVLFCSKLLPFVGTFYGLVIFCEVNLLKWLGNLFVYPKKREVWVYLTSRLAIPASLPSNYGASTCKLILFGSGGFITSTYKLIPFGILQLRKLHRRCGSPSLI